FNYLCVNWELLEREDNSQSIQLIISVILRSPSSLIFRRFFFLTVYSWSLSQSEYLDGYLRGSLFS
ncbi:hypothetical protein L9F63_004231, partial [Diploptera punctata]